MYPLGAASPGVLAHEVSRDVEKAISEIKKHRDAYDMAREYDDINLWDALDEDSRASRTLRQAGIEFDPNFCGVVIDAVANRQEILSVTATSGTTEDEEQSEFATTVLNEIWDENELENYYREWNRNALRDGDAYIVVWPDESYDFNENITAVNITYVDPRLGRMFYDSENPRRKKFFAQMWELTLEGERSPRCRLNLFYNDRIERYISTQKGGKKASEFAPYFGSGDDEHEDWVIPNPWGEIPVFHLRTTHQYGKPEHRNAFALQDGISKLLEMLMVTVEFQGYPQRYAIQEADSYGTQHVQEDPLQEYTPANDDEDNFTDNIRLGSLNRTEVTNETGSDYEANPGGMQLFKNFKEVGEFATADPNAFLDPWREFGKAISSTTDTPLYKFQGLGGQVPSGESLKVLEAPLNKKVKDRNRMFGLTWKKALEFSLRLVGVDAKVNITWENPETTDLLDVWELAKLKMELGVPREFALMQAGVPEHQAREWTELYETKARQNTARLVGSKGSTNQDAEDEESNADEKEGQ